MTSFINRHIKDHNALSVRYGEDAATIEAIARALATCFLGGGRLFICGSGNSRLLAMYTENLFINRCRLARPSLPAVELSTCLLTTTFDFREVYEKYLSAHASGNDCLMVLTSEKPSEDVLRALHFMAANKMTSLGMCGRDAAEMQGLCDILFAVDSAEQLRINEMHMLTLHIVCDRVDDILFSPNSLG